MNRFVGLSLMCLMFLSAQAESEQGESEFRGSSWSLQMSQDNGEPIKVKSERKEYDKTGVTLHRRSQGVIENGVYKPISEQDLNNSSWKEESDIDSLLRIGNQYEEKKENFRKNRNKRKAFPGKIFRFGDRTRRHGYRPLDERPTGFPQKSAWRGHHHPMPADRASDSMKDRLQNRSRVSFYRPVEKLFEKIFGIKKQNDEKRADLEENSLVQRPTKPHFSKKAIHNVPRRGGWFKNFEEQNRAEPEELWKSMREFEDGFFDDEDYGMEE